MIDPNSLFNAAEAIAEDRGFEAAIEELQTKLRDTDHRKEQERDAILHVIGRLRHRQGEHEFYQHKTSQEAEPA